MLRVVSLLAALALLPISARAVEEDDAPDATVDAEDPRPPRPPRAEPSPTIENPSLSVSATVRFPSGFGVDLAVYPVPHAEIGVQLSSWGFISEMGAYARGRLFHGLQDDVTIGARIHRIAIAPVPDEYDDFKLFDLGSVEMGYAHRSGRHLFAVGVGDVIRYGGNWGFFLPTGEVRLGYLW